MSEDEEIITGKNLRDFSKLLTCASKALTRLGENDAVDTSDLAQFTEKVAIKLGKEERLTSNKYIKHMQDTLEDAITEMGIPFVMKEQKVFSPRDAAESEKVQNTINQFGVAADQINEVCGYFSAREQGMEKPFLKEFLNDHIDYKPDDKNPGALIDRGLNYIFSSELIPQEIKKDPTVEEHRIFYEVKSACTLSKMVKDIVANDSGPLHNKADEVFQAMDKVDIDTIIERRSAFEPADKVFKKKLFDNIDTTTGMDVNEKISSTIKAVADFINISLVNEKIRWN